MVGGTGLVTFLQDGALPARALCGGNRRRLPMPAPIEPPRLFPAFRYRDAAAALDWLTGAAGFKVHARHPAEGAVEHAELSFGSAMIMIGQVRDDAFDKIAGRPGKASGTATYIAVDDADALHARIAASNAEIVEGPTDRSYGSREFICRDAEGYVWCFGTYWPKA
jgi:uncharacterized glyoxalase superfamily protein PhnB